MKAIRRRWIAWTIVLVLFGTAAAAFLGGGGLRPPIAGSPVLPGFSVVSADPVKPVDRGNVIGRNWPAADGRDLIRLADILDSKNVDVPQDAAVAGLTVPIGEDMQRWLHATRIKSGRKVGGIDTAAVLRAAGEAVRRAKDRIGYLSTQDSLPGTAEALVRATWLAQDAVLGMAGERLGLVVA